MNRVRWRRVFSLGRIAIGTITMAEYIAKPVNIDGNMCNREKQNERRREKRERNRHGDREKCGLKYYVREYVRM